MFFARLFRGASQRVTQTSQRGSRRFANEGTQARASPPPPKAQKKTLFQRLWSHPFGKAAIIAATPLVLGTLGYAVYYHENLLLSANMTRRFCRSMWTGALISYDYKKSLWGLTGDEPLYEDTLHHVHERSAYKLLTLIKKQGGVYVKLGQHLSSLEYILPVEYCESMHVLHDDAMFRGFDEVVAVFRKEYGKHPDEIFQEFDRTPVAAASLAQVHRAVKDGQEFAVKVQFLDLRTQSAADVKTIEVITDMVTWLFPEFKLRWLIREFNVNLPNELDFRNDANNAKRLKGFFANDPEIETPKTMDNLTTERILTMEFVRGVKVNDKEGLARLGFDPSNIANIVNRVFNEQIFVHGFVHCDPHPGNVFVRPQKNNPKRPQLVLLDNGLYRDYETQFRLNWCRLWMAILAMDEPKIQELSIKVGLSNEENHRLFSSMLTARSWDSLNEESSSPFSPASKSEKERMMKTLASRSSEITRVLQEVEPAVILLLKTNDLLRMLNYQLGVHPIRVYSSVMKHCTRALHEERRKTESGALLGAKLAWASWVTAFQIYLLEIYVWWTTRKAYWV